MMTDPVPELQSGILTDQERYRMPRHALAGQLGRQNERTGGTLVALLQAMTADRRAAWWHWLFTDDASPLAGPWEWSEEGFVQRQGTPSLLEDPVVTKAASLLARLAGNGEAGEPQAFGMEAIRLRDRIAALPATPVPHFGAVRSCVMWCLLDLHTPTPAYLGAAVSMAQQAAIWRDSADGRTDRVWIMELQEHVLARMMGKARGLGAPADGPDESPSAGPSPEPPG